MSSMVDAGLFEEDAPAGGDGGLGELELADVALGEVDAGRWVAVGGPVQHEDAFLADHGEAIRQGRRRAGEPFRVRGGFRRVLGEPAGGVDEAGLGEGGDRVDQAGAAQARGGGVADDGELEFAVAGDLDRLDGAVGGAHAAADGGALEGGAGRSGGGEQPVAAAEDDLAVGADVDEQADARVAVHAAGQQAGGDVAAHVGAERRKDHGAGLRMGRTPRSRARTSGSSRVDRMNGATPSGSGSMPRTRWTIVALPARATS